MKPLIDIGDPNAPPGSQPWCRWVQGTLRNLKHQGEFAVSNLKYSLISFRDNRHFTPLTDDKGNLFESFERFVECPEPFGLGMAFEAAQAVIDAPNDAEPLHAVLGKHGRPKKGEEKGAIGTLKRGSHSRAYILARLRRADPDDLAAAGMTAEEFANLADRVEARELSATAAAIEAGFRRKPTPFQIVSRHWSKLTDEERVSLCNGCAR